MIQVSERTRKGLIDAIGIPGLIAGLVFLLLALSRILEVSL